MRRALISLSLLHGATLLALAWTYARDDVGLSGDQRSYGAVMLGLAGALMLIGSGVVPKTPALATVPFGLAGLLALLARPEGHAYLFAYGGWALALAVMAIGVARRSRLQAPVPDMGPPAPAPHLQAEATPDLEPVPEAEPVASETRDLATDILRQIPRHRARQSTRRRAPAHRPRRDAPGVSPVTRPQPLLSGGAPASD